MLASSPLFGGDVTAAPQASGPKSGVRLAVVTGLRDQETLDVLALAEIRISSMEGVALLERKDLDPVLAEHALTLSGLVDATMALRLGKLLTVDLLAVVEGDPKAAKHAVLGLVVFDARTGARLFDESMAATPADKAVDAIDRGVRMAAAKHRLGREKLRTLSVPSVRNVDLPLEQDVVCGALGRLLEQRLTASPDLAVLERRYLEHVLRERAASPDAPANALLASMNTVQLELSRRGENGIAVAAILHGVGREPRRVEVLATDGLNAAMADALASRILDELQATDSKGAPNRRMDALRMIEEAEYHSQNRHHDESLACAEASLALEPNDPAIWGRAAGCFAAWIEVTIQAWPKTHLKEGPYRFRLAPPSEEELERTTALFLRTVELWIKCREWEIGRGGLLATWRGESKLVRCFAGLQSIDPGRNTRTEALQQALASRYLYLWWELIGGYYRQRWSGEQFDGRSAARAETALLVIDRLCLTPDQYLDLLLEHARLVSAAAERQEPATVRSDACAVTHIWLLSQLFPEDTKDMGHNRLWRFSPVHYRRLGEFFADLADHPRPGFRLFAQIGALWVETRLGTVTESEVQRRVHKILAQAKQALEEPAMRTADLERLAIYEALLFVVHTQLLPHGQRGEFLDSVLDMMLAQRELALGIAVMALTPKAHAYGNYYTCTVDFWASSDMNRNSTKTAARTIIELPGLYRRMKHAQALAASDDTRFLDGDRRLVKRLIEVIDDWFQRFHPDARGDATRGGLELRVTKLIERTERPFTAGVAVARLFARPVVHDNAVYVTELDWRTDSIRLYRIGLDDRRARLVSTLRDVPSPSVAVFDSDYWWSGPVSIAGGALHVATPCSGGFVAFPLDGSSPKHVTQDAFKTMATDRFEAILPIDAGVFGLTSEPSSFFQWYDAEKNDWHAVTSSRRVRQQTPLDRLTLFDHACFFDQPRNRILFGVRGERLSDPKTMGLYQFTLQDQRIARITAYSDEAPMWIDMIDERRLWAAFAHASAAGARIGVLYELDLTTDRWREVFRTPEYSDHDIKDADPCTVRLPASQSLWGPFARVGDEVWSFSPLARINPTIGSIETLPALPSQQWRVWTPVPTFNELRFLPEHRAVLYADGHCVWLLELPEGSAANPAGAEAKANREGASGNAMADDAANHANTPVARAVQPPVTAFQRERAPAKEPDGAGLVAHWRLDDGQGTSAANAAGNGHAGTLDGGPAWSNDAPPLTGLRGSLAFDGVAAMVQMTSDPSLNPTGSFSLAAWVKIEGEQASGHTAISSRDQILVDGVYTLRGFILRATADGRWQFMLGDEHAWHYATSDFISNDRWTHVVATFEQTETDGDTVVGVSRLFADGALVATRNNARYKPAIDGHPVRIGAGENEKPSGGHRMNGNIADVRIYHRLLSNHEISAMCPWR